MVPAQQTRREGTVEVNHRPGLVALVAALGLVTVCTAPAHAQSVRAQDVSAQAQQGPPDEGPGFLGGMIIWAREKQLLGRLNGDVDGWYPRLGGVTRGSGLAGGPGYRGSLGPIAYDISGAVSIKGYSSVDLRTRWLQALDKRVELWTEFRYEDFREEDYYGRGMSTTPEMRTSYDLDSTDILVRGLVKPVSWARLGTTVGYMRPNIGPGSDSNYPSIEERFFDIESPGLLAQPGFVHTTFSADIDYRDTPANTAEGGFYRVSYGIWNDVTLNAFDFHRFDVQMQQFVPLVASHKHVMSGRIGASYINNAEGSRVPFYFLAYVGGMDTIRSFREFRFKDENAIWLSAEYTWRPVSFLSVALFADAGETRADWQDVDLKRMRTGYGFGFGLHSSKDTFVRFDVGTGGGEGWQFFLKIFPTF